MPFNPDENYGYYGQGNPYESAEEEGRYTFQPVVTSAPIVKEEEEDKDDTDVVVDDPPVYNTNQDWGYAVRPFTAADATLPGWMQPAAAQWQIAPAPVIAPIPELKLPSFMAPGVEGMFADPGYQHRVDMGRKVMENSAAGRGTLRTGGTLKAFSDYGQQSASQEYQNVWNRASDKYGKDVSKILEEYQPKLTDWGARHGQNFNEWQIGQQAGQRGAENALSQAWREYLTAYDMFRDHQESVYSKTMGTTQLGLGAE